MDKMLELGTVNDRRYAQGLARTYVEVRKYGYYRAYQQMRQKGLTKPIIEEALEEYSEVHTNGCMSLWSESISDILTEKRVT